MKMYDFTEKGVTSKLITLDGCLIYLNPEITKDFIEAFKKISEKDIAIECSVFCKQKPPVDGKPLQNVFYLNPVVPQKEVSMFVVKKHKSYRDYVDFNVALDEVKENINADTKCDCTNEPPLVVVADSIFENDTQTKSFYEFWLANKSTFEKYITLSRENATSVNG